jgi:hypothetical protein
MFNWFKMLFGVYSREIEEPKTLPCKGEAWVMIDKSPWGSKRPAIKILDYKEGWVRYYMGPIYSDERMELETFLKIFQKKCNDA